MKAKGIPEKIYLQVCGSCEQKYCDTCEFEKLEDNITWSKNKIFPNDVEYTRTDAFIEKACKYWYQYNQDIVKKHGSKAVLGCSEFTVNVGDFKKYMEDNL